MEINQLVPALVYGDAVSNHALEINKLLRSWGYDSHIYAEYIHPRYAEICLDYRNYNGAPENITLFHYAIGSRINQLVPRLPDRLILYYHNITPSYFLRGVNRDFETNLREGRAQLTAFKDVPLSLAASEYNRRELLGYGFKNVRVVPYILDFARIKASAENQAGTAIQKRYRDGLVNIVFIGRIAPNKCYEDLIRIFNYYHKLINPNSRLLLPGSWAGTEFYHAYLEALIRKLGLQKNIHFCGHVGLEEGLGAYYKVADLFLCMSEHEGFCIPLLEAAYFGTPLVAYNATGVSYTLAEAGVLVNEKKYDVIAEIIDLLVSDSDFRTGVVSAQFGLLENFAADKSAALLRQALWQTEPLLA